MCWPFKQKNELHVLQYMILKKVTGKTHIKVDKFLREVRHCVLTKVHTSITCIQSLITSLNKS